MKKLILAVGVVVGIFVSGCGYREQGRQEGYDDAAAGVPAEANPYRGANNSTHESRGWLDGWKQYHQEHKDR